MRKNEKAYRKKYYQENKEKIKEYQRERYQKMKNIGQVDAIGINSTNSF